LCLIAPKDLLAAEQNKENAKMLKGGEGEISRKGREENREKSALASLERKYATCRGESLHGVRIKRQKRKDPTNAKALQEGGRR